MRRLLQFMAGFSFTIFINWYAGIDFLSRGPIAAFAVFLACVVGYIWYRSDKK